MGFAARAARRDRRWPSSASSSASSPWSSSPRCWSACATAWRCCSASSAPTTSSRSTATATPIPRPPTATPCGGPLKPALRRRPSRGSGPRSATSASQLLVPAVTATRTITARAGGNESDTVLIEGRLAELLRHRPAPSSPSGGRSPRSRTAWRAPVAVLGANVAAALFGAERAVGQSFLLGGERYFVVGVLAKRKGTFFGENRNDNVVSLPLATARPPVPRGREHWCSTCAPSRACASRRARSRDHPAAAAAACGPERRAISRCRRRTRSSRSSTGSGAQIFLATMALAARQPAHRRHRHRQRHGHQRDRADARDRRAAGHRRAAPRGAAPVPVRGGDAGRRRAASPAWSSRRSLGLVATARGAGVSGRAAAVGGGRRASARRWRWGSSPATGRRAAPAALDPVEALRYE